MLTQARLKQLLYLDQFSRFHWIKKVGNSMKNCGIAGSIDRHGYIKIRVDNFYYLAHRLAWLYENGEFPEKHLDHINRIKTDNRISNLRPATCLQNSQNHALPQSNNESGYRGVSFHRGKWRAVIYKNKKQIYLGNFKTIAEANSAYLSAKTDLHNFFFQGEAA